MKKLKFALIGCGRISKRHINVIREIEEAELVAVCDIDQERVNQTCKEVNVPGFTDMHEMMKNVETDVVCILTPSGYHGEHTVELAHYGKHIIIEKPMALTLDDADRMIEACSENGIKLFVVKQNRFNRPVLKLREAIDNNRFGKMVLGTVRVRWCRTEEYYDLDPWRGTWALDGGVLANQSIHHIDLLQWCMGEVTSVFAKSATALSKNIEVEDTAVVVLKFRNGALGIIEATTATRPKDLEGSISILGEKGTVEIAGFAVNELKTWNFADSEEEDLGKYSSNPPNVYGFGHLAYYKHIIQCITSNKKQLIDGLEGRKSLELISAIYESIETGKEVFLRFNPKKCKLGHK